MTKKIKFVNEKAERLWNKLHGIDKPDAKEKNTSIDIVVNDEYNINTRKMNDKN